MQKFCLRLQVVLVVFSLSDPRSLCLDAAPKMSAASAPAFDTTATPELDNATRLPAENRRSFWAMIAVQALNAFNDNFVKVLLIVFAGVVAKGTDLGDSMQVYLGAIFSVPYVLFAPVAGWLSDRFSKMKVMFWMQVVQVAIFVLFLVVHGLHDTEWTLWLSLGCFFLLATQAAFFSPAKFGIVKELVGSRRMGSASGTLQMTNLVGILAGMGLAGFWFASRIQPVTDQVKTAELLRPLAHSHPYLESVWYAFHSAAVQAQHHEAWHAVTVLLVIVTGVAVLQIVGSLLIKKTPSHEALKFHPGIWTEHITHLKLLFSQRPIKLAALGVTYFWFMSNAVGSILVTLAHELHPSDGAAASREISMMPAMLGIGIMLGSLLAGYVCRRRIELGLVPLSGYFLAASLFWGGAQPVHPFIYIALIGVGMAGGAFMTPLYAFVQDRCKPEERGRILSAMNLMDCVGGIVANIVLVKGMLLLKVPAWAQLLVMVPLTLGAAVFITRLLPRNLLIIVVNLIVRTFYRIRTHHEERMPKDGPLLVLPNHVSYADAIMLGLSSDRMVNFVMLDSLYKLKWMQWFLKLFGTVPISATKAKEAIRTVAESLKEGKAVALFPEGQLSRTGFLNEVRKGYELMARMAGENVRVQPVYQDGLWGSIFSFEGGRFFKKVPRALPYRVNVWFGEPMDAKVATAAKVREALMALSAEAFFGRRRVLHVPRLVMPNGTAVPSDEAKQAWANASRIFDTSLLHEDDLLLVLLRNDHPLANTFLSALPKVRKMDLTTDVTEAQKRKAAGRRILAIGDSVSLAGAEPVTWDFALELIEVGAAKEDLHAAPAPAPALYDATTGALLTLSVPNPPMPPNEEGLQHGLLPGTLGHVLPGLVVRQDGEALILSKLAVGSTTELSLPGFALDAEGFVVVAPPAPAPKGGE
jgi:acyl-[acyl-carrier-protein]-phospholipid O-acyltransferase/long-chain-fatty-acid--[acyl-carrier-protein] ligase